MSYFLAIDAGGTKTIGAIADEHRELARAQSGTIKLLRTGEENARRNLESLLNQLAQSSGIDVKRITRTCIGTSGYSVPLVANWIRNALPQFAGGEILLCGDEEIALDAAFSGGPGVLVVAGTGSNVVGRAGNGQISHAGGWGPALADEGSGYWIGHEGLRSAFRALSEDRPTMLIDRAIEHWRVSGLEELIERANANPSPDFPNLVPIIVECALAGDSVAREVLDRGGKELAHLAQLVIRKLHTIGETALPTVAFTGSVLHHIAPVRDAMIEALRKQHSALQIIETPVDPIAGALWRARSG